ncbi:MAG: MBL fold metallo-hydrolase [Clostridia bacterium]|nr:MBL fold metallo-hydrolase [Clostridia bacterium]
MSDIRIHVFHTGEVCVAPDLPFGGDNSNAVKASGVFGNKEYRLWLPVSAYLIEHPAGIFLVDTGWARDVSPNGEFDKKAQIRSLGSVLLYAVNQGRIGLGQCIDEQLAQMGIRDSDLDAVLITHLDCDHANGLKQVKGAKRFLVAADEVKFASKVTNRVRYYRIFKTLSAFCVFQDFPLILRRNRAVPQRTTRSLFSAVFHTRLTLLRIPVLTAPRPRENIAPPARHSPTCMIPASRGDIMGIIIKSSIPAKRDKRIDIHDRGRAITLMVTKIGTNTPSSAILAIMHITSPLIPAAPRSKDSPAAAPPNTPPTKKAPRKHAPARIPMRVFDAA